jgi:DNA-binding response OmpR family regulator
VQTEPGDAPHPSPRKLGGLELDVDGYRAFFDGRELCVSASQVEALNILLANSGRVVSRDELRAALGLARPRSVDVILSSLRREVGRDFLRNVRSRGWIVVAEELDP